ncbi:hypothetical protein Q4E40_02525 [Pontibacter sp. BT731]|uniref:hypothetical protein n=1 Tax=Pontibacter coccineus TaxID=3063328 RepID=UPI0026E222F0|nr:hypothetical protein [Pontibacter sp. BT731]MDO6388987.1 hypothetical protein [Pontibacter sp. BT731]
MPQRILKLIEAKPALVETALYLSSWLYLTLSPYDLAEKIIYGVLTGVGVASGKWIVEAIQKRIRLRKK